MVTLKGVTPAEAAILVAEHHRNVGGNPLDKVDEGEEVERSAMEERNRLFGSYGKAKVVAMYPGGKPQLPDDYKEAVEMGLSVTLPTDQFVNGSPQKVAALTGDE